MKTKHLLLLILIAVFSSCSSAYRIGQTPDDVYYSPAPPPPVAYVTTENQQDKDSYAYNNATNSEDLAIRRGINDPRYRSNISLDFGSGYSPYDYYGSSFYSPLSPYYYNPYGNNGVTFYSHGYNYFNGYNSYNYYSPFNNNYYSPFSDYYYTPIFYGHGSPASNYPTGPRTFNLGAYNNANRSSTSSTNRVYIEQAQPATNIAPARTFPAQQPVNRNSGVGNFIRRVFSSSDNNVRTYNNDNNTNNTLSPARTIQSNTSGSNSSSSGSSGAPVRTFRR